MNLDSIEPTQTEAHTDGVVNLVPTISTREKIALAARRVRNWMNWKRVLLVVGSSVLVVGVATVAYVYQFTKNDITDKDGQLNFFQQVGNVVGTSTEPVRGQETDRVNILLMGKGGAGHDGGELVDTVMVASLKPSTGEVALISLPRDLVVPFTPEGAKKPTEYPRVNYMVYKGGVDFARESMKTVLGLDIHYYALVDFSGFRNVVDTIDGIDLAVPNGFTGYYGANELSEPCPRNNKATLEDGVYCAITFVPGTEHMNGERALQYARIRKMAPGSESNEGSDFKRAARQQLVLQAIKDKTFSASTLLNPVRANGLLNDFGDHVSTDMEAWEMLAMAQLVKDVDRSKIKNIVIDQGENGLVKRIANAEAYLLEPNAGPTDYSEIQAVALGVFDETSSAVAEQAQTIENEHPVIILQNGTATEGLASRLSKTLETVGIPVASFMNAAVKTASKTTLIDLSGGTKPETRKALEARFKTTAVAATLTPTASGMIVKSASDISMLEKTELPNNTDFVVVVGADQVETTSTPTGQAENTNSSTKTNTNSSVRVIPAGNANAGATSNTNTQ
jgi:LCP family protein required for cell wall assembly